MDRRNKASRKDAQISEWEQDVVQARREKERTMRKAGIAEKNRVDVQTANPARSRAEGERQGYAHGGGSQGAREGGYQAAHASQD